MNFFMTGSVAGLLTQHHHSTDSCRHTQAAAETVSWDAWLWVCMCIRVSISVCSWCLCVLLCMSVHARVRVCVWVDPRMALALLCLPFCLFVVCLSVKITALTLHSELTNVYNTNDAWRPLRTANKYHTGDDSHYLEQSAWMHLLLPSVHQCC